MFSQLMIENIGYYVYCLVNPKDNSNRMAFYGGVDKVSIRYKYIGKPVKHYFKQGKANLCEYVNIWFILENNKNISY